MTTVYKLTDGNMQTYGGFQWKLGETKTVNGKGKLCGPGWLHAYEDPLLAVLLYPIHVSYKNLRLFRAKGRVVKRDGQIKCGCKKLKLVEEIPLPVITTEQRVRFAILSAWQFFSNVPWRTWAIGWLTGKNRTAWAARAARAAEWAADAAAWDAKAWAARAAAWAADAAAWDAKARARAEVDLIAIARLAIAGPRPNPFGQSL